LSDWVIPSNNEGGWLSTCCGRHRPFRSPPTAKKIGKVRRKGTGMNKKASKPRTGTSEVGSAKRTGRERFKRAERMVRKLEGVKLGSSKGDLLPVLLSERGQKHRDVNKPNQKLPNPRRGPEAQYSKKERTQDGGDHYLGMGGS